MQAANGVPDDPFTKGLRRTYNDLETAKAALEAELAKLAAVGSSEPATPRAEDLDLVDALPYLSPNLAHAPQPLPRCLFDLTQLTVRLHDDGSAIARGVS